MAQGLQIWDEHGNMVVDITDSFQRFLGWVETGVKDGSYYDQNLLLGEPWYMVKGYNGMDLNTLTKDSSLEITIANGTITWKFKDYLLFNQRETKRIFYGVY